MVETLKLAKLLNDLIRVNNDRISCYEKNAQLSRDISPELKNFFHRLAREAGKHVKELSRRVSDLGLRPATGTTWNGKLYGFWDDIKEAFTGYNAKTLLCSCRNIEAAALACYEKCLQTPLNDDQSLKLFILAQRKSIYESLDLVARFSKQKLLKE